MKTWIVLMIMVLGAPLAASANAGESIPANRAPTGIVVGQQPPLAAAGVATVCDWERTHKDLSSDDDSSRRGVSDQVGSSAASTSASAYCLGISFLCCLLYVCF
jgi:hypothetical protein